MKTQTIMWTALPNGIGEGGRLRLSVFVSPRLQTNEGLPRPTLSQFSDFLDWPASVAGIEFSVRFDNGPTVAATRVMPPDEPSASELWRAMFGAETFVRPYEFPDLSARVIRSFSVRNVADRVQRIYGGVAKSEPTKLPDLGRKTEGLESVQQMLESIVLPRAEHEALSSRINAHLRATPFKAIHSPTVKPMMRMQPRARSRRMAPMAEFSADVPLEALSFHQFEAFHAPLNAPNPRKPSERLRVPVEVPDVDFHEMVSSLGQYPAIMWLLGLVVDLEVDFDPAMQSATAVRVAPTWEPEMATAITTPRTRCSVSATGFAARPRSEDSDISNGMLELNDDELFEVGQMDVDGAGIQTLDLANRVARAMVRPSLLALAPAGAPEEEEEEEEAEEPGLPSLRTAGLWVARINRASEFAARLIPRITARNEALAKLEQRHFASLTPGRRHAPLLATSEGEDAELELFAEDLVRGYRVDIWDSAAGRWRSLCERVGTYRFENVDVGVGETLTVEDEGWVSSAATGAADGSSDELRLHEALFRWQGWSLCAPRPGGAVMPEGVPQEAAEELGLDVEFVAKPGSLPRLRFGNEYRVRARVVDLAGNGLGPEVTDSSAATAPITYSRHEPLTSPTVVPRKDVKDSPGETAQGLVIRSYNDAPPKDTQRSPEVSERHVAPPQTSQLMAEMHGMFDGDAGMMGDAGTYNMIVDRDRSLGEFHDVNRLQLPYLPDAIAFGALLRLKLLGADGEEREETLRIPFVGEWPDFEPFRIEIAEPASLPSGPEFDEVGRVLRVPLAKAHLIEVQLSCYMPPEDIARMAVWQWTVEDVCAPAIERARLAPAEALELRRQMPHIAELPRWSARVRLDRASVQRVTALNVEAIAGRHWMLTPFRTLTLVHAVQQPLVTPEFEDLAAHKNIGDTFASLTGKIPIDGKSTSKVDVLAEWEEPVDDVRETTWRTIQAKAHVVELPLERKDEQASLSQPMLLRVPMRAVPAATLRDAGGGARRARRRDTVVEGRPAAAVAGRADARVSAAAAGAVGARPDLVARPDLLAAPAFRPEFRIPERGRHHEFGDTKYRRVTYNAVATTRFREYFPFSDEDIESGRATITRTSEKVSVDVLSSARPVAPKVLYVIPTFGWQKRATARGLESTRRGGGLRVYLERPWFSSGDGELLGVVLPAVARGTRVTLERFSRAGVHDTLKPYVTQMGADPIWRTAATKATPSLQDFKRAITGESGLTLDELPGSEARVAVAGHEVSYDADRQLWYCDIEIDAGDSYYPFVRLALARYQPHSVTRDDRDVKLSRIVLADFAQLTPDRAAAISFDTRNRRRLTVSVSGVGYAQGSATRGGSEMEVSVEKRAPGVEGDLGWTPVADAVFKLEPRRVSDRATVWSGTVTLPANRGTEPFRLVIKEYERFLVDKATSAAGRPVIAVAKPTARRLVYADAVEV